MKKLNYCKTICFIQLCEYETGVRCDQCGNCIKPKTRSIRITCSCGCNSCKVKCTNCKFGSLPGCEQERKRLEDIYIIKQEKKRQEQEIF